MAEQIVWAIPQVQPSIASDPVYSPCQIANVKIDSVGITASVTCNSGSIV
jgi:hypothetical protein